MTISTISEQSLQGVLTRIQFQKDAFLIGRFTCATKEVTALGRIIGPEIGTPYNLHGKWVENPKWGHQFQFDAYTRAKIVGDSAVVRYLSKTAKWIGEATARAIVKEFGDTALDMLQTDPHTVSQKIKGLSLDKAIEIQTSLQKNAEVEATLLAIEEMIGNLGILHKSLVSKIAERWGSDAIGIIKANPYRLTEFSGIGFKRADAVALGIGFDPDSLLRQSAAVQHLLKKTKQKGHSWASKSYVLAEAKCLIGYNAHRGLEMVLDENRVIEKKGLLALRSVYEDEMYIAQKLRRLSDEIPY